MLRKLAAASVALLVLFHAWLFGAQLVDGRLADAGLLLRWAAAGLLLAALWHLRRQGVSLVRGRRAVAVWLMAALLHGPAALERLEANTHLSTPETVVVLIEFGAILLGAGFTGFAMRRRVVAPVGVSSHSAPCDFQFAACLAAPGAPLAPRPPPVC